MDGFQCKDNVLEFFPTAEGYVKNENGALSYVFQYKDHLGNVRVSYAKNPQSQVLEIIEENNYYQFGLKHQGYNEYLPIANKYKYNGKELQDELGLNMYDYGARNYDPAIGRWMNIDPLAETSRRFSTYTYALNNPVFFIDPDGMKAEAGQSGNYYDWDEGIYKNKDTGKTVDADVAIASHTNVDDTYTVGKNGEINHVDDKKYYDKNGKEVDKLIALDSSGKRTSTTMDVSKDALDGEKGNAKQGSFKYYFGKNNSNMKQLFNFLSYNTNVEWSLIASSKESYITTSYKNDTEFGGSSLLSGFLGENGTTKYSFTHSHPNGYPITPSGIDGRSGLHGGNDIQMRNWFNKWYPGRVTFSIYNNGKTLNF